MSRRTVYVIGGVLAAVVSLMIWRGTHQPQAAMQYREVRAQRGSISSTILSTGLVEPQNRLELKSPVAGRIEEISVTEGAVVRRGAVLVWMSSSERAALLDSARARGADEIARWEELYKPTPIYAPLDGMIIARSVEPGQTVTTQDVVLVMSDRLIIRAQVDETDIGAIARDQAVMIELDAYPGKAVKGTVDHIAYEAITVNNVTIYEVEILPSRVPSFMRSGMTANVTFTVDTREDVLLVPASAVVYSADGAGVRVQGDGGTPVMRQITAGLSDGRQVEVVTGLSVGEAVLAQEGALGQASNSSTRNPFMPTRRKRT